MKRILFSDESKRYYAPHTKRAGTPDDPFGRRACKVEKSKRVRLIPIGGKRTGGGLNDLTCGSMDDKAVKSAALEKAKSLGFKGGAVNV